MKVDENNRSTAAGIYNQYKAPFLETVPGAVSKELLIRKEDVQVLHGFESEKAAHDYLVSKLFNQDVVVSLKPLLQADPEVRVYAAG